MTAVSARPLPRRPVPACFNVNGIDSSTLHAGDEVWTVYQPEAVLPVHACVDAEGEAA